MSETSKQHIVDNEYIPHPGQMKFHTSKARFRIICCGRKWGKTTMLLNEALYWLGRPNTLIWWVAPYFAVAQMSWNRFLKDFPRSLVKRIDRKNFRLVMINDSEIWFKSGDNPDSLVGEGIDLLIIDEAARLRERVWFETLRPNLSDPGRLGYCAMASTPTGYNWFYYEWLKGLAGVEGNDAWEWDFDKMPITGEPLPYYKGGFPTWSNPMYDRGEIPDLMKGPRSVFLQEYGARFLQDLGSVFDNIKGAINDLLTEYENTPYNPIDNYSMGVDLGKTNDYTVITIVNEVGLVVYWERFRRHSWTYQVNRIIAAASIYGGCDILIDSTGLGDPVYDFIAERYTNIKGLKISSKTKKEIIENLSIELNNKAVTYPPIPELLDELGIFGVGRTSGGTIKYEAPSGHHDDCVISLALAVWSKTQGPGDIGFAWLDI